MCNYHSTCMCVSYVYVCVVYCALCTVCNV
jgi:hypothetical protein